MEVRTRIAPSPTGEDLHIGTIYTSLINWAFAKKNKGKFILRLEDTDRERLVEGSEERFILTLKDFGLVHDEGPDIGGPYGPYKQSERVETYKKYAQELVDKEAAYVCYCSKEKLEEIKAKQEKEKTFKRHIHYCDKSAKSEKYVIRLKVPENQDIKFNDLIRGEIIINTNQVDDQVLLKSDGFPTYHLAVVVDDYLMEISHVIRAEEWISSMPKHVLLYQAFGWEMPVHAHLPLLRNPDKSKLSKRRNPVWASWYLEQGYLKEALLNYLSLIGWSHHRGEEIFSLDEFVEVFDLKRVHPVGPAFDITKLEWMSGEYIRRMSDGELTKRLQEFSVDHPAKDRIAPVVPLIKERIKKLSDFIPITNFLWEEPEYEKEIFNRLKIDNLKSNLEKLVEVIENLPKPWVSEEFEKTFRKLAEDLNLSTSQVFQLIRVAISGQTVTPPLFESIQILGEEETVNRIKKVLSLF